MTTQTKNRDVLEATVGKRFLRTVDPLVLVEHQMLGNIYKAVSLLNQYRGDTVQLVAHLDADGLAAAGIIKQALEEKEIETEVKIVKMINKKTIDEINQDGLTILADLGSGQLGLLRDHLKGKPTIIIDHHPPQGKEWKELIHINPLLDGHNSSTDVSGAGVAYLVAKALDHKNADLASLAVVGAVGDLQNCFGRLEGLNREILCDAVQAGKVEKSVDILLYGRYTRPIFQALQYFTDPRIPGVSGSEHGSLGLLQRLGINLKDSSGWRSPSDLEEKEKRALASAMVALILPSVPKELASYVPQLVVGEVYSMVEEPTRSPLKDVAEYVTCLNACGRHERPEVGIKATCGCREDILNELLHLLRYHRQVIAKGIRLVEEGGENGIQKTPSGLIQYFNAENNIKPSIIGTVAGMLLGSEIVDPYLPILGFSWDGDGVKVSARCSRLLVLKGVNMAKAVAIAAKDVNGMGGGHPPACGAYLPDSESVDPFLLRFEDLMVSQLSRVKIQK